MKARSVTIVIAVLCGVGYILTLPFQGYGISLIWFLLITAFPWITFQIGFVAGWKRAGTTFKESKDKILKELAALKIYIEFCVKENSKVKNNPPNSTTNEKQN